VLGRARESCGEKPLARVWHLQTKNRAPRSRELKALPVQTVMSGLNHVHGNGSGSITTDPSARFTLTTQQQKQLRRSAGCVLVSGIASGAIITKARKRDPRAIAGVRPNLLTTRSGLSI
jgi:hypothetical protein